MNGIGNSALSYLVFFIVNLLIVWVILSVLLMWFKDNLYTSSGSLNWWMSLAVAAIAVVFVTFVFIAIGFIFKNHGGGGMMAAGGSCKSVCSVPAPSCAPVASTCDPCSTGRTSYTPVTSQKVFSQPAVGSYAMMQ